MTEAARIPMARASGRERADVEAPEEVTFPEVVWAHHLRERELHGGHHVAYEGPAEERYRAFREQFEKQHGRIVDEYWCSDQASAAVVCLKEAGRPLRWLGKDPSARIYSETNWKTRDLPVPVAELVHEADALAMHAREVLRSTAQRLVTQRLFGVMAYLLGTFDGKEMTEKACKPVIESATNEVAEIRKEYVTAATRSAQIVYFWGMVSGLVWLGILGLLTLPLLDGVGVPHWGLKAFYGCAVAGALGAMVSVVARMNQSSFKVEYDVGRPTVRRLGAFRPLVGAVFGVVIYLALQSHLMHIDTGAGDQQFPFFAVWAFIAGFSERFVRDTLDGVEASVGGLEHSVADPPPPPGA